MKKSYIYYVIIHCILLKRLIIRVDLLSRVDTLVAPYIIIYSPTIQSKFKVIVSRSQRSNLRN